MPIVECRLWEHAVVDWEKVRLADTNDWLRCSGCSGVFPGRYRVEINVTTGLCRECEAKEQRHA